MEKTKIEEAVVVVNLEQLKIFFPKQLCLEFDAQKEENARKFASQFTDQRQADLAYLNTLCLEVIIPSIEDIFDLQPRTIKTAEIKQQHRELWKNYNGVTIATPQSRLVLIPTDELDTEELRVPQAWVDQQELAGDFYLAIQVSPENSWLRVWGFTNYQQLKELGVYDPIDRSYAIDRADLWFNLESLSTIREFSRDQVNPFVNSVSMVRENILRMLDFSALWQPIEEFITTLNWQPALELRQHRFQQTWARKIDESLTINNQPLALTIEFQEDAPDEYAVRVRLLSGNAQIYLPDELELLVLEPNGNVIDQSTSRDADNWIQVGFKKGKPQEKFEVRIQRAETVIISENFVI